MVPPMPALVRRTGAARDQGVARRDKEVVETVVVGDTVVVADLVVENVVVMERQEHPQLQPALNQAGTVLEILQCYTSIFGL